MDNNSSGDKEIGFEVTVEDCLNYIEGSLPKEQHLRMTELFERSEDAGYMLEGVRHVYATHGQDRLATLGHFQAAPASVLNRLDARLASRERADGGNGLLRRIALPTAAAASFLLIVLFIWQYSATPSYRELAMQEVTGKAYPDPFRLREGGQAGSVPDWQRAYQAGNYPEAAQALEAELSQNATGDAVAYFYAGISFLYDDKPEKAVGYLSSPVLNGSAYEAQALWYRAIAYMLQGQAGQAGSALRELQEKHAAYKREQVVQFLDLLADPQ